MKLTAQTVRGLPLPAGVETAHIDGASLAYLEQGDGQPVVFVHGSVCDQTIWEPQLPAVGREYRAIAYSRRYAWPNDELAPGAEDWMEPHVDDLLAFQRAVDAYPAHLVGNSWGAFICLKAALREPAAVRSLVLEEPPLVPLVLGAPPSPLKILPSLIRDPRTTLPVLRFGARTLAPAGKLLAAGDTKASIERFVRGCLGDDAFAALPEDARAHMLANASTHAGQFRVNGGFAPITAAELRSIKTPALVLEGANSPPMFRRLCGALARLLPNSQLVDVPDASHLMHLENPDAVNARLMRFLGQIRQTPGAATASPR